MGTRSLTIFEDNGQEIAVLYRQFDGYPEGHGKELAEFLKDMIIVNGISLAENRKIANGMSCLAAQIIAHFKTEVGEFYLYPAGTRNCWEEYTYTITGNEDELPIITVCEAVYHSTTDKNTYKKLFKGDAEAMLKWIEKIALVEE